MKRSLTLVTVSVVVLGFVGMALALGGGNYRKGKYLFRKNCRLCHMENATGPVQAKTLEPATFTMDDWVAAFSPDKAAAYPCKETWDGLKKSDINDIFTYMHKFAKDSPTPLKCK